MYEKEVVDQEAKIEKMKADQKDEYDIKKQVRRQFYLCISLLNSIQVESSLVVPVDCRGDNVLHFAYLHFCSYCIN